MSDFYKCIGAIKYRGSSSGDPLSFKFYDRDRLVAGKPMSEHLKFAMSYWHTMCAGGTDMFGSGTIDKSYGQSDPMKQAKAKADAAFEFMDKLGLDYYCFHDRDIAPMGKDLAQTDEMLDEMCEYLAGKQKQYGKKLLWGTSNLFNAPMYMDGAGSSCSADVFAFAAAQVKKALDVTMKLSGDGFVFWGGREGYETLLNTDMALETSNVARLFGMARDYARGRGFKGAFYIEPKPKEPMKHQYDFDASTAIGFLRKHGLQDDFRLNIEANHATLAGHTFQHELRVARDEGFFGSIDANMGDLMLGWDTDCFPTNVYDSTMAMYEVLKAGGFKTGGLNFDAKTRRPSNTYEDLFAAYIAGMDTFALGLLKAEELISDGRIDNFVRQRYSSFDQGIGARIVSGEADICELEKYALEKGSTEASSGHQEQLESIVNQILFGGIAK